MTGGGYDVLGTTENHDPLLNVLSRSERRLFGLTALEFRSVIT